MNSYGAPVMYDYINERNSQVSPSMVHVSNTGLSHFFRRYLLQKAMSVFKWDIPETWSEDYFLYTLYCWGYLVVINTTKFGVIPQQCGLQGYDIFYRPNTALVVNALFDKTYSLRIGSQCTLFKLQPDYGGIMDLVSYYADLMALTSETLGVNIINSKLSYVFTADNKQGAESLKKLYDDISSGKPAVAQDAKLLNKDGSTRWEAFQQNVGQNYIADRLLTDIRKIENMFNTAIGIPNANTEKKERMNVDEVNKNEVEVHSKCELWLQSLQESCKKANEMFGIKMSVDWRNKPKADEEVKKVKEVAK